ncbi:hypothetical protein BH09PLA1_BH09PLA1_26300 [soil metagenome]
MRSFRFRALSVLALAALTATTTLVARADEPVADSFPGVWRVTVTPDNSAQQSGKQEFGDEVLFEEGKITAAACASYGFGASDYATSNNGQTFTTTMSADGESIVWTANRSNSSISGTVVWTKSDGHVYHYVLSGSRLAEETPGESAGSGSSD